MPDHFLWQEDSLRREWELRFAHQSLPMWGVAALAWDQELLQTKGRFLIKRLQLVFETGELVDVPGNARQVWIDLPRKGDTANIYVHLDSAPEVAKGELTDQEGRFMELRWQKLLLDTRPIKTPLPGFKLLRLSRLSHEEPGQPKQEALGWQVDPSFVPALITTTAFAPFAELRLLKLNRAIEAWTEILRKQSVESCLAVHKRVEAAVYLRQVRGLGWELRQVAPSLDRLPDGQKADRRQAAALQVHPFELYRQLVALYLDIFSFQCGPLQTIAKTEPEPCRYQHEGLARCFREVEDAIDAELARPRAKSPAWEFDPQPCPEQSVASVCVFPGKISPETELYFLIQLDEQREDITTTEKGIAKCMAGLKLAAPARLDTVYQRALPGIGFERVKLIPFPHNFDSASVQFWRVRRGPEWEHACQEGAIAYYPGGRPRHKSFLYSPDVRG
jgi:predicted component of type VI protein secretion system